MGRAIVVAAVMIAAGGSSPLLAAPKDDPRSKECVIQGERIDCSCVGQPDRPNRDGKRRCRDDRVHQGALLLLRSWLVTA
jgi:hypothetical protein